MNTSNRIKQIAEAAILLHIAWMNLVNFNHPYTISSHASEALEARRAKRDVEELYDEAFAHLTAECELYRQECMNG